MEDRGPAYTGIFDKVTHYRYQAAFFVKTGMTYGEIITGTSYLLSGFFPASGVSYIVPSLVEERICRIIFTIKALAYINNTLNANIPMPIQCRPTGFGNDPNIPQTMSLDNSPIAQAFAGDKDYIDYSGKISRINVPQIGLSPAWSAADFEPTVVTPQAGAVHTLALGLLVDLYAYKPCALPGFI